MLILSRVPKQATDSQSGLQFGCRWFGLVEKMKCFRSSVPSRIKVGKGITRKEGCRASPLTSVRADPNTTLPD